MQLPPRDDDWQRSGQVSLLILSQRNKCTYVFHRLLQCNRPNCASAAHTLFSRKKKEAGKAPKRHSKRQQPGNIIMMVCLCFYLWPIILYVLADRENIPTMFCSSELWLCFCCMWSRSLLLGFVVSLTLNSRLPKVLWHTTTTTTNE